MRSDYRVLMVMPDAFHLGWLGATRRLFHLAGAFRELGFAVALLAGKITNVRVQAQIDRQFPGVVLRSGHTGAYPRLIDVTPISRRAWRALWKVRGLEYYMSRLSYGWAEAVDVNRVMKELEQRFGRPNLIWGVCTGYLAGGKAADRLAKLLGVPWVFELQDPPWGCGLGPGRETVRAEFKRLLESATKLVVVTESYRRKLLTEFTLNSQALQTIYLTYDCEPISDSNIRHDEKWRVVYTGSLDGGRTLTPLFQGVHKALSIKPQLSSSIGIEIAGKGSGLNEARRVSKVLGLQQLVRFHGYLACNEAGSLSKKADALVVMQTADTSMYQIPGKIFEYVSYGKPILAIMPPECEAADILRRSGLGFIHHAEDIDGIADTLIRLWSDWRAGAASVQVDRDFVSQFSVRNLPEKLRSVLEGLV